MPGVVVDEVVVDGARLVTVRFDGLVVMPYVRQTRKTRWRDDDAGRRAQEYNATVVGLRTALQSGMNMVRVEPFEKVRLGFSGLFWLERNVGKIDLDNLVKASLDCARRVLIPDDCWVYKTDGCEKNRGRPAMVWKFWELGG